MNASELLTELRSRHVQVSAAGGNVRLEGPDSAITDDLTELVRTHKPELLEVLAQQPLPDWNDHPDTPPSDSFTRETIQGIKAGMAVPVWSAVLGEWLWFVRDEKAKAKLVAEGCQVPIYTLGELAVVVDKKLGPDGLKDVHAIKKKFGATIEWPPKEAG